MEETKLSKNQSAATTAPKDTPEPRHFFAKKYHGSETASALFKHPKFYGALLGEMIGTMLLTLALSTIIGVFSTTIVPLLLFGSVAAAYFAVYHISGAHLNPIITASAMATRRISVIRGLFYILVQFIGAWLAFFLLMSFQHNSTPLIDLPVAAINVDSTTFWAVALIELVGAISLGFMFTRSTNITKKNPLPYTLIIAFNIIFLFLFGTIITQEYYGLNANMVFNPASASVYPIFANLTDGFGQVVLTALAYFIIPMIGGIIGALVSDSATYLAEDGYPCKE